MSYLVIGGTGSERQQKALKISNIEYRISKFDTILVEGETSIGIDQIRDLCQSLALKPYNSPNKAAIIHPGELLTAEAQNALLKTLEEASESSILILTAPNIESLLPTVVSRCQIIKLPPKSEIKLTNEEFSQYLNILISLLTAGVGERLKIAVSLAKNKEKANFYLDTQIFLWREILLTKLGLSPQYINMLTRCKEELEFLTARQIINIIKNLEKTKGLIEQNINPRLALEIFLLDLPTSCVLK